LLPSAQIRFQGPLGGRLPRLPSLRLQGLVTLVTFSSLGTLVGSMKAHRALGIHPTKPCSLTRCDGVPTATHPPAVFFAADAATIVAARHRDPQLLGFCPDLKPRPSASEPAAVGVAPLGFALLGSCWQPNLIRPSSDLLSCASLPTPESWHPALQSFDRSVPGDCHAAGSPRRRSQPS